MDDKAAKKSISFPGDLIDYAEGEARRNHGANLSRFVQDLIRTHRSRAAASASDDASVIVALCARFFKDTKQLERDMGNSERVLFQNYIRPVPAADGRRMLGLCLHWSAPREKSAMGSGKKFRKKGARATASARA